MEDIIDYKNLSNKERIDIGNKLRSEGKNYCTGILCQGKIKLISEFSRNKDKNVKMCKLCNNYNFKLSMEKNDRACRREKNKLKFGKICEICGNNDIELLEFDHIDAKNKVITISI